MDRKINNLRFNQDYGCFTCAMESGIRIYNVQPLVEKCHYDRDVVGSVSKCEMLYRSNLFAVVSGGSCPKYADTILHIYDDLVKKPILQIKFPSSIKAVRLANDRLVVALLSAIHVFTFPSPMQKLFAIETLRNPRGLLELSASDCNKQLIIFPGHKTGTVQIVDLCCTEKAVSSAPAWITAHKANLMCIALNQESTKIATASTTGTLIRVWDIATKTQLVEFRRGSDNATIYCLNFSITSDYLCCSSDKGTIHIFAVKNTVLNKRGIISKAMILGDYKNSQWALANFTVPPECACICCFTPNNAVIAVCLDGTFHKYVFNNDGNCNREAFDVFLDVNNDDADLL